MTKRESFIHHLLLILAVTFQMLASATVIANFGWFSPLTIIMYVLLIVVYGVVYLQWKN